MTALLKTDIGLMGMENRDKFRLKRTGRLRRRRFPNEAKIREIFAETSYRNRSAIREIRRVAGQLEVVLRAGHPVNVLTVKEFRDNLELWMLGARPTAAN